MSDDELEPFHGGYFGPGGQTSFGGKGQYVRSRPVGLKTVAAITAAQWIGRRMATRLTPIFLLLMILIGIPLAFYSNYEWIVAIGVGFTIITYATQRHVNARNDRMSRQWAMRTAALPITGTIWITGWRWMHTHDMDVINEHMIVAFWIYGCLTWAWLHISHFVGGKVAWERAQRDFRPVADAIGVPGAAIVKSVKTAVGTRKVLDVRGTGKTASELAKDGHLAEQIAAASGSAPGMVRVSPSEKHAGYVEVSHWTRNPWENPIPHPEAPDFARKPGRKLQGPIIVGLDPETGRSLRIELVNDEGGIHWLIVAGTRGGKTNLINNCVLHLTDCLDDQGLPIVKITMIDLIKGDKDAANWAVAVDAVYAGKEATLGALAVLQQAVEAISERAKLNGRRGRSKHVPTADEPAWVIFIDEASSLLEGKTRESRRAIGLVNRILQSGASELIILVIAAQRAVLEHLGGGDVKANAFGKAVLPVSKPNEQSMIISDWRDRGMPDMSTFGKGAKGTVLIVLNNDWSAGRAYELWDMLVIRRIAAQRCLPKHAALLKDSLSGPAVTEQAGANPLQVEPPEDGKDDPDVPDLDFDASVTSDLPASGRPGASGRVRQRPDAEPDGQWSPAMTPGMLATLRRIGLTPGTPQADAMLQGLIAAGVVFPDRPDATMIVTGEDAEDDDAADAAVDAGMSNVRAFPSQANPLEGSIVDEDDAMDAMEDSLERMREVTAWAARQEAARTPEERQELVDAWRHRSWILDQDERLPGPANACLSALAHVRGPSGFTRQEAQQALYDAEAIPSAPSLAAMLRILTNQGHLQHLPGMGPGGGDLWRLGQRHMSRNAR